MKRYFGIEILRFLTLKFSGKLIFFRPRAIAPEDTTNTSLPFFNFLEVFYKHGILGVDVFYTISGLVFAHIYLNSAKHVSSKDFFINRFANIFLVNGNVNPGCDTTVFKFF